MNAQSARNRRDPEDRRIDNSSRQERREKMLDKTIADSFPASDPPSSLPDPEEDSFGIDSLGEDPCRPIILPAA